MTATNLATRLKELRTKKGLSQEALAEESGLSLRTIQRIENSETKPTGETLKRLANTLDITPNELIDWSIKEDSKYLLLLNTSSLFYLFFPILGILIPFILWTSKKDTIKDANSLGKKLINFQITWTILLFFFPIALTLFAKIEIVTTVSLRSLILFVFLMYTINLIFILMNTIRINNKRNVYYPSIRFLS